MTDLEHDTSTIQHMSWKNKIFIQRPSSKILFFTLTGSFFCLIALGFISHFLPVEISVETDGEIYYLNSAYTLHSEFDGKVLNIFYKNSDSIDSVSEIMEIESGGISRTVKANTSGILAKQHVRPGQIVKTGDSLLDILPPNNKIVVVTYISPTDIYKIKKSAKVYISIDAFSKTKFGYFSGKVSEIDLVATPDQRSPSSNNTYKVMIEFDSDALDKIKHTPPVPGMKTETKIVWKKNTPLHLLVSYFLNIEST